jgi:putative addiction module component (TIGR02574 family)
MSNKEIISEALNLPIADRLFIVNRLVESFNPMDKDMEKIWLDEVSKRVENYNEGNLETLSYKEFFSED